MQKLIVAGLLSFSISVLTGASGGTPEAPQKPLRILAIGNSFSVDAMQHLYQIATNAGFKQVVLGNLNIGGCSLERHWKSASEQLADYNYRKNSSSAWVDRKGSVIDDGLLDEDWDFISIQQVSGNSGLAETYNSDLDNLVEYINSKKTNPDAKIMWHMTWAYQSNSKHQHFPRYNSDQRMMYQAIVTAVQEKIVPNKNINFVIPSGTAIQNMRTSYIGDTLTRDGFHLSLNLGRYIAGMTWLKTLTGVLIDDISWVPNADEVPPELLPVIKEAVNNAVKTPFSVTESSFKTK
ncbi:MAG: DUF4886 domain-containing protein [Kiritimatiellales bacterium]